MKFSIPGLAVAALILAACSSDGNNEGTSGSAGASSGSSNTQVATTPAGPKPGSQLDLEINVGDRVFFAFDSSALSAEARTTIERWAAWMKTYPANRAIIEGHADERGTREYNLALGERRADSARDYLVSLGVDPNRVKIVSFGKERPAVPGSNERAWAQNRRAVLVLDN
ncbi:MAG: peptidoglycan-associated lipoprotein Pal [Alphaproteobacteria bacterium]|nr:peptidoglycan-associated lipoprotein Pal [Alphaproteobacteria bacterium]